MQLIKASLIAIDGLCVAIKGFVTFERHEQKRFKKLFRYLDKKANAGASFGFVYAI